MADTVQTKGTGKPRRSRSKGQQIIDVMTLIGKSYEEFALRLAHNPDEVEIAPVAEIVRLAGKLDELIRIPR
jgi:hypothetical protein